MIKNTFKILFPWMMLGLAFFHIGTIRRDEDPILRTQTDPIALKQKLEEIKDGVKAAPAPSFKYYEKEDFLARSPMKSAHEEQIPNLKPQNELEAVTEVQPEEPEIEILETEGLEDENEEIEEIGEIPQETETSEEAEDDWWVEDEA